MRGSYPYKVTTRDDGQKEINFPQFPGMTKVVAGDLNNKAVYKAAHDYLLTIFATWMDERLVIPGGQELDSSTGDAFVFVSWLVLAKINLYHVFREADVSRNAFAKQIGISQTSFGRLMNVRHESKEQLIFSALDALGIETTWDMNVVPVKHSYPA